MYYSAYFEHTLLALTMFVELFEVTGTEDSVREALGHKATEDFQHEVEAWLKIVNP